MTIDRPPPTPDADPDIAAAAQLILRRAVAAMRGHTGVTVDRMMRGIAALPDYRRLPSPTLGSIRPAVRAVHDATLAAIENGELPDTDDLASIGRQRAEQRIPVDAVLAALEIGNRIGWQVLSSHLQDEPPSPALQLASTLAVDRLIAAMHRLAQRVEAEHSATRDKLLSPLDRRRSEVTADLLLGRFGDDQEILHRAATCALELRASHAVLLLASDDPGRHRQQLRSCAAALLDAIPHTHLAPFLDSDRPHIAALLPSTDGHWRDHCHQLADLVAHHPRVTVLVALEPGAHRPTQVATHYTLIRDVIPLAIGLFAGTVVGPDLLDLLTICSSDPGRMRRFVERVCGDLLTEEGASLTKLVGTTLAYYAHRQNVTATAAAIGAGENTVRRRLFRVQEATGRDVARHHMHLELAFMLLPAVRATIRATSTDAR